jgi:phosphate transport system permease protein
MTQPTSSPAPVSLRAEGAVARRQAVSRGSRYVFLGATLIGVFALVFLAYDVLTSGLGFVDKDFFTNFASRRAERAGLRAGILGTAWILTTTIILAIPVAIGTAIFLEEFAPKGRITGLIRLNIANLAGVPSIIYGILGLTIFVRGFEVGGIQLFPALGGTVLAGALTLALMILPMTVIASVEAIRQVPPSIRDGSLALGATRWQTVWNHTLPGAVPGIMTGTILAIARAAGETAALIMIGASGFLFFDTRSLNDDFITVPVQIYVWTTAPRDFQQNAAAGIIVLMVAVLGLNLIAVLIRERFRRQ